MSDQRDVRVSLQSASLDGTELDIHKLVGVDQISGLFSYTIEAARLPGTAFDEDALMLQPAWLSYETSEGEVHAIYGLIWKIREHAQPGTSEPVVEITLVPRTYASTLREMLDIFMEQTVPEIIEACLTRCGLEAGEHFDLEGLEDNYQPKEFVVQYRETDFSFICRLCEHHGIFFFIDHSEGRDVLTFGDRNAIFPTSERTPELPYRPLDTQGGLQYEHIQSVHIARNPLPTRYTVRDYNYRIPGVDLMASADVDPDGLGEIVEYGAHFKGPDEGQWFANIRAQELIAQQRIFTCLGNPMGICAGQKFMLLEHPNGDLELLVTSVTHAQGAGDEGSTSTTITAIPAEVSFRPRRLTPKPSVKGIITGMIDAGVKDGYADVDDQGRYRVRFMFDTAGRGEGQASRLVRMAQPHAGEGYGMHFPLRPGTEVLLSCIDGDPDRPIIMNTVPNPSTVSPVSSANRDRNLIRTGGGNEIDISDEEGMHRIKMTTPHLGTVFQLGAENAAEVGAIISTHGNSVAQVADTVGAMSDVASTFADIKGSVVGKSVTSLAGVPSPIEGFEAVDKMLQSGAKAVASLAKTVDTMAGFGKALNDSNVKNSAAQQKSAEDAILAQDPAQTYADDKRVATVGTPPVEVAETEAQFRKRVVEERIAAGTAGEENATAYTGAVASGSGTTYPVLGTTLDGSMAAAYADSNWKAVLDSTSSVLGTAAKVTGTVTTVKKNLKKLFSNTHKDIQKAMDNVAFVNAVTTVGLGNGAALASLPRKGFPLRTPGTHYNLVTATDSVVLEGMQAFYGMSKMRSYIYGGTHAMVVSDKTVGVYSGNKAELAAPYTFVTSTVLSVSSRDHININSGKYTTVKVGEKLKVVTENDTSMESKKKFFLKTKDLLDVDGGDEAKLKAKKWSFDATEGDYTTTVKGKYELGTDGSIELKNKDDSRFMADGKKAMLQQVGGSCFTAGASTATIAVDGGAEAEFSSSSVKVKASSSIDIDAGTINVKGKVMLG